MSSANLVRWSGLALLIAGALVAVATPFHPDEAADPNAALTNTWVVVHSLYVPAFILGLFGLVGLYARQAEQVGVLGLIGFVLAFIGSALFLVVLESSVIPVIAADAAGQTLLDPAGPLFGGALGLIFLVAQITFALGFILTGITTARAGVLPRWPGLLILIGSPLVAFWPPLPQLVGVTGGVLFGLGYVWIGYAMWTHASAQATRQPAHPQQPAHP